jgi:hypothetical protein
LAPNNGINHWKEETHKTVDKKIKEIFSEIKKTAPESRSYDLNILLARLAEMNHDKKLVYKVLVSIKEKGTNDPEWNYLMGNFLYDGLPPQKEEALKCYNKIITLSAENNIPKEWQLLVSLAQMAVVDLGQH